MPTLKRVPKDRDVSCHLDFYECLRAMAKPKLLRARQCCGIAPRVDPLPFSGVKVQNNLGALNRDVLIQIAIPGCLPRRIRNLSQRIAFV